MTSPGTLAELEQRLKHDLSLLNYPPGSWVPTSPPGISDVVILGGGMCGLAAAFSLFRQGIHRIRILDRSDAGREGPWSTYARMETLRSPKQLIGPAAELPSLTFRAWFEAQFGQPAWTELDKIPRLLWMDYLIWYRNVLKLPVENNVEVTHIGPAAKFPWLQLDCESVPQILARKIVLATGRAGQGAPSIPTWIATVPRTHWSHSSDSIDFPSLRRKRVAVIGAGASAMDNAAAALEAGAAEVRLLIRRSDLPRINKLMGIGSSGFTSGYPALSDAWRWRIMHYGHVTQTPAPRASVQRVSRHPNAFFHTGHSIASARLTTQNELLLMTVEGASVTVDFLILGTGFTIDMYEPKGLVANPDQILTWRDRYAPPPDEHNDGLASSPYLGSHFEFQEKHPGESPWLRNLFCFNHAASLSLGKVSGDIPRVSEGAAKLATGISTALYVEDIDQHWTTLQRYNTPELFGDEWTVSPLSTKEGTHTMPDSLPLHQRLAETQCGPQASAILALRPNLLDAMDRAYRSLFEPTEPGSLNLHERASIASQVAALIPNPTLATHYSDLAEGSPKATPRAAAIQRYTELAATRPADVTPAEIATLTQADLAPRTIVTLAQVVAFVSYQARVLCGLNLFATPSAPPPEPVLPSAPRPALTLALLRWQPWLTPVEIASATPEQHQALVECGAVTKDSPYFRTLALDPAPLRERTRLYNAILFNSEGLSRAEREFATVCVSTINGCIYCTSVHARRFAELTKSTDLIQAFLETGDINPLPIRLRHIQSFARKLTLFPATLNPQDRATLDQAGFTPIEILDLIHATSLFAWANRLMQTLGEPRPTA